MSKLGQQLLQPENGWRRYNLDQSLVDDNFVEIYGSWTKDTVNNGYMGDRWFGQGSSGNPIGYRIRFRGTSIRLVTTTASTRSKNIKVDVDGTIYTYTGYSVADVPQIVVFEILGMANKNHKVEVYCDNGYMDYDCVDINSDGRLLSHTTIASLTIVKSNDKCLTFSGEQWKDTGLTEPLSKDDFKTHGIDDISNITNEQWEALERDEFEIITWTDEEEAQKPAQLNGTQVEWLEEGKLFETVITEDVKINTIQGITVE